MVGTLDLEVLHVNDMLWQPKVVWREVVKNKWQNTITRSGGKYNRIGQYNHRRSW